MDLFAPSVVTQPFRWPARTVGDLAASEAAELLGAAGDVTMVLDRAGVIQDVAIAGDELAAHGMANWVGRPWSDTVTPDSRAKIDELLRAAAPGSARRWRQVNHPGDPAPLPIRYLAVEVGHPTRTIAIGRDLRGVAAMQQRLLAAQQSMERDYLRLRQAEQRYRMLFESAGEAILVVDGDTRRVVEANPAAERLAGRAPVGQSLESLFAPVAREAAAGLLAAANGRGAPVPVVLTLSGGGEVLGSSTIFRRDAAAGYLIRLSPLAEASHADPRRRLLDLVERLPDAFAATSAKFLITTCNVAFLELAGLPSADAALGLDLAPLLGRAGIDLPLIAAQLAEHGAVRGFATIFTPRFGAPEEVEVSAAYAPSDPPAYGFSLRPVRRDRPPQGPTLPRPMEQLTELVGRVPLKDIVRESTDMIERLCIEAALRYTADNRASAAEILGLSRQSLYSKLHRHGLGNLGAESE